MPPVERWSRMTDAPEPRVRLLTLVLLVDARYRACHVIDE
jgi:hypothetical protein